MMKPSRIAPVLLVVMALSACATWFVHPLPPTINGASTADYVRRLYVRMEWRDAEDSPFPLDVFISRMQMQVETEGIRLTAYCPLRGEESADVFSRRLEASAILDIHADADTTQVSEQQISHEERDTEGKKHTVTEKQEFRTKNSRLRLQLREPGSGTVLAELEKNLSGESAEALQKDMLAVIGKWLSVQKGSSAAADETPAWFRGKVAVLPFSDEVTSLEGPPLVRRLVWERLKGGGYDVLSLESVDTVLREKGITQGGQLKRLPSKQVAEWLHADRLLYGHVDRFDDIRLGLVGMRAVAGRLRLYDARADADIWTDATTVGEGETARSFKGDEILGRWISQLARSWWEALRKKPLGPESVLFAQQVLTVPMRLPEKHQPSGTNPHPQ